MPEPSLLDVRLAEIDRRLRTIQTGLGPADALADDERADDDQGARDTAPDAEPIVGERLLPPPTPLRAGSDPRDDLDDVGAPDGDATGPLRRLTALSDAHERLLELHRELLSQYAEVLALRTADPATAATPPEQVVPVTAGPFPDATAVRAFERALWALPQVAGVAVREYLGDDRVVVDVRLTP